MNAAEQHRAMTDLRAGRITPDQFRAIMRASRAADPIAHEAARNRAIAATNR